MKLLITGAHSPAGQATVALALAQGHQVRAVLAPAQHPDFRHPYLRSQSNSDSETPGLEWVPLDWLKESGVTALTGMDAAIHLDEVQTGPFEHHFLGTVETTERLLQDMARARVRRLVLRSSLAVYRYQGLHCNHRLDETSPLESAPEQRSPYVQAKLMQEALLVSFGQCWGGQATILRPGALYGPGQFMSLELAHLMDAQLSNWITGPSTGPSSALARSIRCSVGRLRWRVSPQGKLPLLYTEHFAQAALAALVPAAIGESFNLVDDDLPSRQRYCRAIAPWHRLPPAIPCPWPVAQLAVRLSATQTCYHAAAAELSARFKPLAGYSNTKAKRMLGWQPQDSFTTIMARFTPPTQSAKAAQPLLPGKDSLSESPPPSATCPEPLDGAPLGRGATRSGSQPTSGTTLASKLPGPQADQSRQCPEA